MVLYSVHLNNEYPFVYPMGMETPTPRLVRSKQYANNILYTTSDSGGYPEDGPAIQASLGRS